MIKTLATPFSESIICSRCRGIISAVIFGAGNAACHGCSVVDILRCVYLMSYFTELPPIPSVAFLWLVAMICLDRHGVVIG